MSKADFTSVKNEGILPIDQNPIKRQAYKKIQKEYPLTS